VGLDLARNPYTPGAGMRPAVLSGREREIAEFEGVLHRLDQGRGAQCTLVVGLRGVGKTVLLSELAGKATARGWVVAEHEVRSHSAMVAALARMVREAMVMLAPPSAWRSAGTRVLEALRGLELSYSITGLTVGFTGAGDRHATGDLGQDMSELLVALGAAAVEHQRGVVLMLDELQFASTSVLGGLAAGLHRVAQRQLPVTLVAAGLPQTRGLLGEAASYTERMFRIHTVGALRGEDAREALVKPAELEDVRITDDAVASAINFTEGYPFFLQVFGDHLWRVAENAVIQPADAERAAPLVRDALDEGFFTFRTDRLPAAQRRYLRAMAELGPGEHASGEVAEILGMRSSTQAGPTREALIRRGLIYSTRLGYADFTVPQFDVYLRRHFELEVHVPRTRRPQASS